MIDADEIMRRLKAVQELLEQLEGAEEVDDPEVETAAEVARLMKSLADDLGSAVASSIEHGNLPAAEADRLRLKMDDLKTFEGGHD